MTARSKGIVVGVILVLVIAAVAFFTSRGGPCDQAQQAYQVATTSSDPADRAAAYTLYLAKKAECDAQQP